MKKCSEKIIYNKKITTKSHYNYLRKEVGEVATQSWLKKAQERWGEEAEWITGDGQYALLAWCRVLTVTLWSTRAEAEEQKRFIDEYACGGLCTKNHEIIDLGIPT